MTTKNKKRKRKTSAERKAELDAHVDGLRKAFLAELDDAIANGVGSWSPSWRRVLPTNATTGESYNGRNLLVLALQGVELAAGFGQWQKAGCAVAKGSTSKKVLIPIPVSWTETDDDGNDVKRGFTTFKLGSVFSIDQLQPSDKVDELRAKYLNERDDPPSEIVSKADDLLKNLGIAISHGGSRAFYRPSTDAIRLPARSRFETDADYVATKAHEVIHATGAKHRLNREGITSGSADFGSPLYAFEELVAEIGSGLLCSHLGIPSRIDTDHAPYLESWRKVIAEDDKALLRAAKLAADAVAYVLNGGKPTE